MNQVDASKFLERRATQFELACRAAGIGVWELHVEEDRLLYSDFAKSIFGFPQDGAITRQMVHSTIFPEDLEAVLAAARRAMDPGVRSDEHYLYRIRRFDTGEPRWLRGHGIAQFEGQGETARPVIYAGSVQDITDRELMRQKLAASEERFRLAVDAAQMAVWDLDLETGEVAHSPDLNRMLGFPEDSRPTHQDFRSRYVPGERERIEQEGAAARERGETSIQTRVRYDVPGKGIVTYVLRAALAKAAPFDGRTQRVIGVLFDATDQARAEERLVTMNHELRHRLKNMANLAGIFARQTWDRDARLETFLGRIRALSLSADVMFGPHEGNFRLESAVDQSLAPFKSADRNPFAVDGPGVEIPEPVFTGLVLILHELATNAVKHGALLRDDGLVHLAWELDGQRLSLEWRETDGPPVSAPTKKGFGTRLVLNGALPPPHEVTLDFQPGGLVARVSVLLDP